ncbi:MAG: type II secretion system protein [Thermodesulfobacteria bacterium]|nr:type II secretion system protein [Thermodesulfobacteriota bacterium]
MRKQGLTLTELLIGLVISGIVAAAILGLYVGSNKSFKRGRKLSELMDEVNSAIVQLDFLFSRWGAGVPCANNTCVFNTTISACGGYPPSDPMCMDCLNGSLTTGCTDIVFYGNLGGLGFVVNSTATTSNVISCRLSVDPSQNYYYIWNSTGVILDTTGLPKVYQLSGLNPNDIGCIDFTGVPNAVVNSNVTQYGSTSTYTLLAGNLISRVPHKIELLVVNGTLVEKKWDLYNLSSPQYEGTTTIGYVNNFQVTADGRGVKVVIDFVSSKDPNLTFHFEKYYSR